MLHKIIVAGLIVAASQAVPVSDSLDRLKKRLDKQQQVVSEAPTLDEQVVSEADVSEAAFDAASDSLAKNYPACIEAGTDREKFLQCRKEVYYGNFDDDIDYGNLDDNVKGLKRYLRCKNVFGVAPDSPYCKCAIEHYKTCQVYKDDGGCEKWVVPTRFSTLQNFLGRVASKCGYLRGAGLMYGHWKTPYTGSYIGGGESFSSEMEPNGEGDMRPSTDWFGHRTPQQCKWLCGSKGYLYTIVPPDNNCKCADAMSTRIPSEGWQVFKDAKAAVRLSDVVYPPTGTGDMSSTTGFKGVQPVGDCISACIEDGYEYAVVQNDGNCKCAPAGAHSTSNDASFQQYHISTDHSDGERRSSGDLGSWGVGQHPPGGNALAVKWCGCPNTNFYKMGTCSVDRGFDPKWDQADTCRDANDGLSTFFGPAVEELHKDEMLCTDPTQCSVRMVNGEHKLLLEDGNLVLYNGASSVWSTGAKGIVKFVLQGDGNLVAYDGSNGAQFASAWGGHNRNNIKCCDGKGDTLKLQSDGNLILYNGGRAAWAANAMFGVELPPGNGDEIGLLKCLITNGWRSIDETAGMSWDDMRNTIIVELHNRHSSWSISWLQGKNNHWLGSNCN